jgi:RNA methyltransferase, TrmH family
MITSTSNPRIKEARKLSQRRHREAQGRLLIEGVRLIRDGWQSGVRPIYLFYASDLVSENSGAAHLLAELQAQGVEALPCSVEVLRTLSETVTPQGLVAVVPLPTPIVPPRPTLTLVLDQLREPGNAGTLLRTAEAAGVDWVLCTPGTVDPFHEKVLRAGMGAHFRLPVALCADWATVEERLPARQPLYLAEASAAVAYEEVAWREPAVLVVGGEASGASEPLRAIATPIAIPMQGRAESLNAAIAGAVILFEAARQRRSAGQH